jgi:hypothetical protein
MGKDVPSLLGSLDVAITLVALAAMLSWMAWHLIHAAPPLISRLLPQPWTYVVGALLLLLGVWGAFTAAEVDEDPSDILFAMVRMYVGLWFMLAPSAGMRGSEQDVRFLRRVFGMIAIVMAMIIGSMFLDGRQAIAALQLAMIAGGCWLTLNWLRLTDRGG